jgi:hypothetical protein
MNLANEVTGTDSHRLPSCTDRRSSLNDTALRNRLRAVHEATSLQNSRRYAPGMRQAYALKCQNCAVWSHDEATDDNEPSLQEYGGLLDD